MAKKRKEDKKYKGPSTKRSGMKASRRGRLRNMAKSGGRAGSGYMKYGDIDPNDVHEGGATYRGTTIPDTGPIYHFSINVFRGHGKEYFIWKGPSGAPGSDGVGLYKSDSGSSPTRVQV